MGLPPTPKYKLQMICQATHHANMYQKTMYYARGWSRIKKTHRLTRVGRVGRVVRVGGGRLELHLVPHAHLPAWLHLHKHTVIQNYIK